MHVIVARREPGAPLGARLLRLRALVRRHELDHGAQRKRHDVDDVRADRHLALEAAAGEAAVAGERLPQGALGVGRIAAQQPRQPAHRAALAGHDAAAMLGEEGAQLAGLRAVEDAALRRDPCGPRRSP